MIYDSQVRSVIMLYFLQIDLLFDHGGWNGMMQSNSQKPFQYATSPFKWFVLTRKTILIIFLICVCFAYFGPHYLMRAFQYVKGDYSFDDCVQK